MKATSEGGNFNAIREEEALLYRRGGPFSFYSEPFRRERPFSLRVLVLFSYREGGISFLPSRSYEGKRGETKKGK